MQELCEKALHIESIGKLSCGCVLDLLRRCGKSTSQRRVDVATLTFGQDVIEWAKEGARLLGTDARNATCRAGRRGV